MDLKGSLRSVVLGSAQATFWCQNSIKYSKTPLVMSLGSQYSGAFSSRRTVMVGIKFTNVSNGTAPESNKWTARFNTSVSKEVPELTWNQNVNAVSTEHTNQY